MNTRPIWLACTAAAMFAIIVAPDIARHFDLDMMAFRALRFVRRKWRQHKAAWREIIKTNKDWGTK